MDRVEKKLKDLGRVPRDSVRADGRRSAAWTLHRTTKALMGREDDMKVVLASLRQHGAAVVWGGPGEGKTTVAMEVAAQLRADEPDLNAFILDMRGARPAVVDSSPLKPLLDPYLRTCQAMRVALLPCGHAPRPCYVALQLYETAVTMSARIAANLHKQDWASASDTLQRCWRPGACNGSYDTD